ncbi:MBL fold metallo-hydrolase [Draconibacterium sp.]|nr:MBL fold metallo-hydrolase [Draconibacterium sp.]
MNSPKVVSVRIVYANSILIVNGTNSILVDTGVKSNLQRFKTLFEKHGLSPKDIKLIVLTHTHYDHTGNLKELVKLTGAKVLVHKNEFENLKNGFTPVPIGQGRYSGLISKLGRKIWPTYASPKPFDADLINENEFDLADFEIEGKIISTPGHTNGSQSILIDKKLIAGDTFLNMKNGRVFPPFANAPKTLLETWQQLFTMNIEDVYPGHGPRFKIEKAYPDFKKWSNKLKG